MQAGADTDVTFQIPPSVVAQEVEGEAVILDLGSGRYFGLDVTGTRIWQLLGEGKSRETVLRAMLAEFDVDEERLRRDLEALLAELLARGLVEPR
jgi:hypothetical protein